MGFPKVGLGYVRVHVGGCAFSNEGCEKLITEKLLPAPSVRNSTILGVFYEELYYVRGLGLRVPLTD